MKRSINALWDILKRNMTSFKKKGEDYLVEEIRKLYIRSYNDSIIIYGVADKELGDFLIYLGVSDIPSDKQIEISRITDGLSFKGRIAYESAYKLFMLIMGGKYGLNDAGPVSLAFYRIIESEAFD